MDKAAIAEMMDFQESRDEMSLESVEGASHHWRETEDGGSAYFRDRIQCLKIVPLELWAAIFVQVDDPNDFQSLENASLLFRKVLFDNRVVFLFPKALQLMEDTLLHSIKRDFDQEGPQTAIAAANVQQCISCERIREKQWFSEFLSLRLVCTTWCSELDQVVQERQLMLVKPHRRFQEDNEDDEEYAVTSFETERDIQQFMKSFWATHEDVRSVSPSRSPYLSGCVKVEYSYVSFEAGSLLRLLSLYGHHIRKFDFNEDPYDSDRVQSYFDIRQFLGKMPRLKAFSHVLVCLDDNAEPRITERLAVAPLPTIEKLQLLMSNSPATLTNVLLHSSSHLSTLVVRKSMCRNPNLFLENMSLKLKELDAFYDSLEYFKKLENMDWPLKKLKLYVSFEENPTEWSTVVRVLGNKAWAETLSEVILYVDSSWLDKKTRTVVWNRQLRESPSYRLALPRLKHLDTDIQQLWSLNQILCRL